MARGYTSGSDGAIGPFRASRNRNCRFLIGGISPGRKGTIELT